MAATRRLAAIMFTDMVGSTASAQADEAGALQLRDDQASLVRPLFAAHHGREVKSLGDGFLAEFDSALRAVQCAVDIQQHVHERNAQPGIHPLHLRIGVHLGDVEQRESDIFGDAVNIASRIEPLASPGGICITGAVFDQVRNKLPGRFEKVEPTALKGVRVPVEVYRIVLPWTHPEPVRGRDGATRLAVLPFANISPDPNDEYFADGLTEELITVLSRLQRLRVIARTSVSPYKSTPKSVSQIGTELGVDAILEGSVRKAGDQLRITVQLIDVGTQEHTWANSYDRKLDNVFAVQSEIAERTARALQLELSHLDHDSIAKVPTTNLAAYDLYLKGLHLTRSLGYEGYRAAIRLYEEAIRTDPNFLQPYTLLVDALLRLGGEVIPWKEIAPRARELVAKASELDPGSAEVHSARGNLFLQVDHDWAAAEFEFQRAIEINPSDAIAHRWYARLLTTLQRFDEAVAEWRATAALDPLWDDPQSNLHTVEYLLGDPGPQLEFARKLAGRAPDDAMRRLQLGLAYVRAGQIADARKAADRSGDLHSEAADLYRALLWARVGEKEQARRDLKAIEATAETKYVSPEFLAEIYAALGDTENAFKWLEHEQGEAAHSLWAYYYNSNYDSIRHDPRFQSMLARLNLPTHEKWVRPPHPSPDRTERPRKRGRRTPPGR